MKSCAKFLPRPGHNVCQILNLGEISGRYLPSCWDSWELTEIVEILSWCLWNSKTWWNSGDISSISPRSVEISPWCLWVSESRWDFLHLTEIAEISPWYLWVSQISLSSQWDFLHLAEIGEILPWSSTLSVSQDLANILPKFWKTQTSYQDCQHITQSFPHGINNFPRWIYLLCGWPLLFCFSAPFQMQEAQKWSKATRTWIGFIYQNVLFKVIPQK